MQTDRARSIKRTLEVLEYFNDAGTSATVAEISRGLGYPQSSTSILLRNLMELGYLAYERETRRYRPTARIALLGWGARSHLLGDGKLMAALDEISAKTGELVYLATQVGLSVHYIHVIQATNALRLHLPVGAVRPLVGSTSGHLFLSAMSDAVIADTYRRATEVSDGAPLPSIDAVMEEVRAVRARGYTISTNTMTPGGGLIARLLPKTLGLQTMAVGIGGVGSVIEARKSELEAVIRGALMRHFSLTEAALSPY